LRKNGDACSIEGGQPTMSIAMRHERDNIYRVAMSGLLRKSELEQCETELADEMRRIGRVRLLFVLDGFDGWASGSNWQDLTFYVKHGDAIDRIAIVGDEKWRSEALMFAAAGLRRAPVQFFPKWDLASATTWLSA
jgi:hypothetical protein